MLHAPQTMADDAQPPASDLDIKPERTDLREAEELKEVRWLAKAQGL